MSNKSCIQERNKAIQDIYKRIIHSQVNKNLLSNDIIVSIVLEQPAPRFYISTSMAKKLIMNHYNGCYIHGGGKRTLKKAMDQDLVQNYERLRAQFPNTPKEKIYEYVVEQPAKSFYLTYRCMRDIIFNWTGRSRK